MLHTLLIVLELVAASIWIGGLVAIGLVAHVARQTIQPRVRIRFFRSLGRRYLRAGGSSLLVALVCGALLLAPGDWTNEKAVALVFAAALVLVTVVAVIQARRLTVLRQAALEGGGAAPGLVILVDRRARSAAILRAMIGVLTLALVVTAAVILD